MNTRVVVDAYERFVNPAWSRTLREVGLGGRPAKALGSWLYMDDGKPVLDFVSGYGAVSLGHNHPELLELLSSDLRSGLPNLNPLGTSLDAGDLAVQLVNLARMPDGKVFFSNGGTDAVEAAIKFAMVHTRRPGVVSIDGGFHGLSLTATWLAGSDIWRRDLPPVPAFFRAAPFGDVPAIRKLLECGDVAAVLLEPVQGTAGARAWKASDLAELSALCEANGSLLIFDEVLSGVGRTGEWFAFQSLGAPLADMVLVSKGLTGGLFPVSAVVMQDAVYRSVFMRDGAAKIHGATFGGNRLAMRCALNVLEVLRKTNACMNVRAQGEKLRSGIERIGTGSGLVCEGLGCLLSIVAAPTCVQRFGVDVMAQLWHALLAQSVLTIPAAHDHLSLRLLPPLMVSSEEIDIFLAAFDRAVQDLTHN